MTWKDKNFINLNKWRDVDHEGRAEVKDGKELSTELRRHLGLEAPGDVMRRCRLRWHAHVERKDDADYVKACTRFVVEGKAPLRRP